MKPCTATHKNPNIEGLADSLNPSGRNRVESIQNNICTWCGMSATKFRDNLSRREYCISGFCQDCQDKIFKEVQE